ncbi:Isd11p [Rhodotorula paludigena]|uniref:Isd11p n=1 Tax=Rhodotorula paludigena TaxID=86838 RepID=UPI00317A1970
MSRTHVQALAHLPRQLKVSPSTPLTRTHLLALYKEQLRIAHSFSSYNFKQYFLRRTREKFRTELPQLLDAAYAAPSASSSASSTASSSAPQASTSKAPAVDIQGGAEPSGRTPEDRLRAWYTDALSELAVMARSAIINGMYEAPKLVVEGRGRVMAVGGGGAGGEASYGGAGQPVNPEKPELGTS